MNVRTNLMLPKDLVDTVDTVTGPRGRSRYVAKAVERQLRRDHQQAAFESTFGVLPAAAYPDWSTSDDVVAWVRDRRAETTNPELDQARVPGTRGVRDLEITPVRVET